MNFGGVAVVLPLLAYATYAVGLRYAFESWRVAMLAACVIWGLTVTAITEGLSLRSSFSPPLVGLAWLLAFGVAVVAALRLRGGCALAQSSGDVPSRSVPKGIRFALVAVGVVVFVDGFDALMSAPNGWDAMTYHMSRVMHWLRNQDVADYPSNIPRQLHAPPWAEYAIANLQALSGGDRFANLPQWTSLVFSGCGASVIARELGAGASGQAVSAIVAATLPQGLLQASGAQNNYVESLWLVCVAYFTLRLVHHLPQVHWAWAALLGGAGGLALLTKGTGYVFGLAFVVWLFAALWKARNGMTLRAVAVAALFAIALNVGFWTRNVGLYSSPLGPPDEGRPDLRYLNDAFTPPLLVSNALRNVALELAVPNQTINRLLEDGVVAIDAMVGADVNDPRATWGGEDFHVNFIFHEDETGNPAHVVLIVISVVAIASIARLRRQRMLVVYATVLLVGFLLFSGLFRWQPWHTRLHLPLLVLSAPVVGIVLTQAVKESFAKFILLILIILAIPATVLNPSRPLFGDNSVFVRDRLDQYFANRPELRRSYSEVAHRIASANCWNVGLVTGPDSWEYPMWALLAHEVSPLRLEHVAVTGPSRALLQDSRYSGFVPCAVVTLDAEGAHVDSY